EFWFVFSPGRYPERILRMQDGSWGLTASRNRQSCKNSIDDGLTRHRLGLSFVADDDAMAQHVGPDALHVLRCDVAAAVQERVCARSECEIDGGAWRSAVANQTFESQIVGGRFAR